jgi:hypothetical protein
MVSGRVTKIKGRRLYFKIDLEGGWTQYQVITAVGIHWRHVALVDVVDGVAGKADRYFFSLRAPKVILPFESMGREFMMLNAEALRPNHAILN